jgi:dephospho-CoA kinase
MLGQIAYSGRYRLSLTDSTVVGLTGGIATGKSSVSTQLKSFGFPVVDADVIARQIVEPGKPALAQIVQHFGEDILLPDGTLNRPKLGSIVFNDESQRKVLNGITHPAIARKLFWSVVSHWLHGQKICIVDNPLLIEGGMYKWMGKVVVVYWYV